MLRLASVDALGVCIVWDVGQATAMATFSLGNKHLVDIQWLTTNVSYLVGQGGCVALRLTFLQWYRTLAGICWRSWSLLAP